MRQARALVYERDGDRCRRCGRLINMALSGMDPAGPNLGHIIPAAQGGSDEIGNLGLEHRRCNLAAGPRLTPPRAALAVPIRSVP